MLETEHGSAKALASRFDVEMGAVERAAWERGGPKDWANESIAINTRYVYPLPENHEISEEYAKRALPILHKRLVQAGVRLAWLLNDGLK
jgi:S1/P1 Nuclease